MGLGGVGEFLTSSADSPKSSRRSQKLKKKIHIIVPREYILLVRCVFYLDRVVGSPTVSIASLSILVQLHRLHLYSVLRTGMVGFKRNILNFGF